MDNIEINGKDLTITGILLIGGAFCFSLGVAALNELLSKLPKK
jgi:hypothetical protein